MIKLKPILEKSVKADFIKAISSHKPVVSYRVHADIGDDKVGITGWYTIAVIHDVIDDIKKTGVKILGIEKSTDLKKLHKNVDGIKIESTLKEMIVSDKTDGRVKQMLKKMQAEYPSLNAINYETRDKTYLFAFGKKSDAEKLEKDFANVKSKKGKMKLIRTADYPNDKPPVFIKQYQIIEEAWLKQASPLIEKTETITRLKTIVNEISDEQNEEMVSGVAEILRGVEDIDNRKELAVQMMDKFDKEKVPFSKEDFLKMCDIEDSSISEADSPTERTRRYNRKNKKKVRAYLRKTQDDRVARNGDRAKAIKKHGKAKLNGKDVHHPNGAQNGNWRVVKGDHGPDKKD